MGRGKYGSGEVKGEEERYLGEGWILWTDGYDGVTADNFRYTLDRRSFFGHSFRSILEHLHIIGIKKMHTTVF
jgi:hypothetical protein